MLSHTTCEQDPSCYFHTGYNEPKPQKVEVKGKCEKETTGPCGHTDRETEEMVSCFAQ